MFPTKWQTAIMTTLRERGRCTISELAQHLNVSDETVRRHTRALVEEGRLVRAHGAVALPLAQAEPPFSRRLSERTEIKRRIGRAVAGQIQDGQTVMLDGGSTTAFVAEALLERRGLTVVTNALEIARTLLGRREHRVYLAGGAFRADIGAAVGPEALALIDQFRADVAILSIGAIDAADGFMDFDLDEARIARAMIDAAARTVVAADGSKLGARARVRVCRFEQVDTIVCDVPPPATLQSRLAGTELVWLTAAADTGPAAPDLTQAPADAP